MFRKFLISLLFCSFYTFAQGSNLDKIVLTKDQGNQLGMFIWENEGAKKLDNLTSWNRNELFPSLGLGHFIWYPIESEDVFEEQFPALVKYFKKNGVILPTWLEKNKYAPWNDREQFYTEFNDPKLTDLRVLLSNNLDLQVNFIILRFEKAIPLILKSSTAEEQLIITKHLKRLSSSLEGIFALLDYVNFKGEGLSETEKYQGEGWGLKQVLLNMPKEYKDPLVAFSLSADEVLTRRVKNACQDESRWLKGWRVRINKYQKLMVSK